MRFPAQEKYKAVLRELSYRRVVYDRRVAAGQMPKEAADYQIAIFNEIAEDYAKEAAKERLL